MKQTWITLILNPVLCCEKAGSSSLNYDQTLCCFVRVMFKGSQFL
jgi:hypothetical protein